MGLRRWRHRIRALLFLAALGLPFILWLSLPLIFVDHNDLCIGFSSVSLDPLHGLRFVGNYLEDVGLLSREVNFLGCNRKVLGITQILTLVYFWLLGEGLWWDQYLGRTHAFVLARNASLVTLLGFRLVVDLLKVEWYYGRLSLLGSKPIFRHPKWIILFIGELFPFNLSSRLHNLGLNRTRWASNLRSKINLINIGLKNEWSRMYRIMACKYKGYVMINKYKV